MLGKAEGRIGGGQLVRKGKYTLSLEEGIQEADCIILWASPHKCKSIGKQGLSARLNPFIGKPVKGHLLLWHLIL